MNKEQFDTIAQQLQEINQVIEGLAEPIQPLAFEVLRPYVDAQATKTREDGERASGGGGSGGGTGGLENDDQTLLVDPEVAAEFLEQHVSEKPSDNAKAIAALIFSIYGNVDFTVAEVNEIAHEVGVEVPDWVDVTLGGATVDKKNLFQKRRSGVYRPTANGRKYFKDTYAVSPGTARRSDVAT